MAPDRLGFGPEERLVSPYSKELRKQAKIMVYICLGFPKYFLERDLGPFRGVS